MPAFSILQTGLGNIIVNIVTDIFAIFFRLIHFFLEQNGDGNDTGNNRGPFYDIQQLFHNNTGQVEREWNEFLLKIK